MTTSVEPYEVTSALRLDALARGEETRLVATANLRAELWRVALRRADNPNHIGAFTMREACPVGFAIGFAEQWLRANGLETSIEPGSLKTLGKAAAIAVFVAKR